MKYSITILLITALICQSCIIHSYPKKSIVSLEDAVGHEGRVKIRTVDNRVIIFRRIYKEDGVIYGETLKKFESPDPMGKSRVSKLKIEEPGIAEIRLENRSISGIWSAVVYVPAIFFFGFGICVLTCCACF